jgi:hypothetical protein
MKSAPFAYMLPGILFAIAAVGLIAADAGDKPAVYRVELSDPVAPSEPPRTYELAASHDENGFPAGYSLSFHTHVCIDEQCRMVRVTMHWNALGYYQRLECPPDLPLTRKKHVPFTPEDYVKLDRILRDRDSILAGQPLDALVKPMVEAENPGIDGWSGATPQTVKDSVVEDAAFTTWTMWHWANGEIVPKLQALTEQRVTPNYLRQLLRSEDRRDVDFALHHLLKHPATDELLADDVFHVLLHGDREHVALSLQLLDRSVRDKRQLHGRLIEAFCNMSTSYSPMVLDYFAAQPELPADTLEGLTAILNKLPYFQVHLTLRLLDAKGFCSERAETYVAGLLDHENFFIARRASEHLSRQTLGEATKQRLEAFREKHRDRL